ncbi:feruloyl esterase [Kordiimonas sediminis]|uniref:Feruloyl esterase n=1 Tax=Kordiimonas sediminis TaxID=1735581 RepID=A0A919E6E2_9PROT|nr:tannase/feruloyl esterase family alpha/beta hydrolase [Kordiimonas sediminis]GHF17541.1 feruloyl esterase [Kordiimonas sediminis]
MNAKKRVSKKLIPAMMSVSVAAVSIGAAFASDVPQDMGDVSGLTDRCEAFADAKITGVEISSSTASTDNEALPDHCRVQGTIAPNIGFEARLPLTDWNGKYFQSGCGGFCGSVLADKPGFSNGINEALKKGYAALTTDNGHKGWLGDASWAKDNPEALEVYARTGVKFAHAAGTALAKAYYGAEALDRAYFSGCSNGGRMAAMTAQVYPDLFDGILGGAGVLDLTNSGGVYGPWIYQANSDAGGERILTRANFGMDKIKLLEAEVMRQCDGVDGREDGLISDPYGCEVDLGVLPTCEDGGKACFSAAQKDVLKKWYQGPQNSKGEQLYPGVPPGSERFLYVWFLDGDKGMAPGTALGYSYTKYIGFETLPVENYTAADFDFDAHPALLQNRGKLVDATDPDLSDFRDAGGKYLMWHGLADPLVLPENSTAYYSAVADKMGGYDAIRDFYRYFTVPGYGHCWEMPGAGPDSFDPIAALEQWVEDGIAPESIPAKASDPSARTKRANLRPYPLQAEPMSEK